MNKILVLGGGSWGTTLGNLLAEKDHNVSLWARNSKIFKKVKNIGNPIETSKSLKKLISSKMFNMKANVKKIKTVLINVNKNCLLM